MKKSFIIATLLASCITTAGFFPTAAVAGNTKIEVSDLVVREMLPGVRSTAGYLSLTNHSNQTIELTAVSSPAFERVEIHEHVMNDGMMKMQQVKQNIQVEPHQSVTFSSGGYHLMMFAPKTKVKRGESVEVKFQFKQGHTVTKRAKVMSIMEQQKQQKQHSHSHHH
jgi:copper(I)-binding protein